MATHDPTYPFFPIFTFCGFVAALVPLPWHFQAWNAGTCIYMLWTSLSSLVQFVDSIVWHENYNIVAPVWCDISTKFIVGAGVGIPAASLCINRRLYKIASCQTVTISRQERLRAVYIDVAIAVGLPVLVMILHYIVQGHRFNILEDVGCIPATFNTPLAYFLVFMWPPLLGCISFVYAFLTLRAFWLRRVQFQQLVSSATSMSVSRYFRLMILSCLEMGLTIPISSYSIYVNTAGLNLDPWVSWADTHFNFSHIEQVPAIVWRGDSRYQTAVEMGRWLYPCCAFLFFALFGFAAEARRNYANAFWIVAKRVGIHPRTRKPSAGTIASFRSPIPPRFDALSSGETLPAYAPSKEAVFSSKFDYDVEKSATSTTTTTTFSSTTLPVAMHPPYVPFETSVPSSPTNSLMSITPPASPSHCHSR